MQATSGQSVNLFDVDAANTCVVVVITMLHYNLFYIYKYIKVFICLSS